MRVGRSAKVIPIVSRRILVVPLLVMLAASVAQAGRNAGGALIVHTNDAVSYTYSGDYCGVHYDAPDSCGAAGTRTDKDENTPAVIWLLAAFPDTSSPAVTTIQFGIDHNLPSEQGYFENYEMCGSVELPDAGWPETGFGNLVSFGSTVKTDRLFPFYVFAAYGFEDAYLGTAVYPSTEEAKFVDDSEPPVEDLITRFGTVRWYAAGSNDCPGVGGGEDDSPDDPGGDDVPEDPGDEAEDWLDGDGETHWVANRVLARLADHLSMPPREPVRDLGIDAFDDLGRELGVVSVQRVLRMRDSVCSRFPVGSRLVRIELESGADEHTAAGRFAALSEVVWAQPDYAFASEVYGERTELQWYLLKSGMTSCEPVSLDSCCVGCDIGVDTAWQFSRGSSTVNVAFYDTGADMQHPDLFDVWARNPDPREDDGDGDVELCSADSVHNGDINGDDADSNGVDDDVLLGYRVSAGAPSWKHDAGVHGSGVAGLLGAISKNNLGIASVAGGNDSTDVAGVRLIQFSRRAGMGDYVPLSEEIGTFYYATAYRARVYSTSASISDAVAIRDAIGDLADSVLFIAAAGNNNWAHVTNPFARVPGVMAIGGYQCQYGGRWIRYDGVKGSDYGIELSVLGPTNWFESSPDSQMVMASIYPTTADSALYRCTPASPDSVDCFGGTSAATPIVASIAALLFSYSDEQIPPLDLTPAQVRKIIERTAEDILCDPALIDSCGCDDPAGFCADSLLGWDRFTGYGRVDAGRAFTVPVVALDPLQPYADFVIWGGEVRMSWELIHLPSVSDTLDHFRLDYLIPEDGLGWHAIDDDISLSATSYTWIADSLSVGDHRYIRLAIVDPTGEILNAEYRRIRVQETTDVDSKVTALSSIQGVWPNPSGAGARVRYTLTAPTEVLIEVFDVGGRHVRTIARGMQPAGVITADWNGRDDRGHAVASGIYFIRFAVGSQVRTVRVTRVR